MQKYSLELMLKSLFLAERFQGLTQVWIQDLKSSNGTFINGVRLSEEGEQSKPFELNSGDILEFGVDIKDENGTILYKKVSCSVSISYGSETIAKSTFQSNKENDASTTDLMSLLDDEIKSSNQAALALDKIRKSFELIDAQKVSHSKTLPQSALDDISIRLTHVQDRFANYIEKSIAEQKWESIETEIESIKSNHNEFILGLEPFRDQLATFETRLSEARQDETWKQVEEKIKALDMTDALSKMEGVFQRRLDLVEKQIVHLKELSQIQHSENERLNKQLTSTRSEVVQLTLDVQNISSPQVTLDDGVMNAKLVTMDAKLAHLQSLVSTLQEKPIKNSSHSMVDWINLVIFPSLFDWYPRIEPVVLWNEICLILMISL